MEEFLPHYINFDFDLPKQYHYEFGLFFNLLQWKIDWKDVNYTQAEFNIADVKVDLTRHNGLPSVSFEFPAIKHWEINADQNVNFWFLPDASPVQLILKDFKIDAAASFVLNEKGYLDPMVEHIDINFGQSYLYHNNPITAFIMHQYLMFGIVVIEDSIWFIGTFVLSHMLGPIMDDFLNHYMWKFTFPTMIRGQHSQDEFTLDFHHTQTPFIGEGYIDMYLKGELLYRDNTCDLKPDQLTFLNKDCPKDMPANDLNC